MEKLKPCPKYKNDTFKCNCHIQFFTTHENPPKNIRVGCLTHRFQLGGSYETIEQAESAWNRRANNEN